jgi:hypothetical protein
LEYFALEGSFLNQFRSTPRCIHYRGVDYKLEELREYSKKFEILSRLV